MNNTGNSTPSLMVATLDGEVIVKICGRANLGISPEFKRLLAGLIEQGHSRVAIDFRDCPIMDSTFSGVLAGMGQRLARARQGRPVCLIGANEKILDLLQSLGVEEHFDAHSGPPAGAVDFRPATPDGNPATKLEIAQTCLEAHRKLCELNAANEVKFKDVTAFLEEDLKRLRASA
jgi:anti-anti-sigma regulatory factor